MNVVGIFGSPSRNSRSTWLLQLLQTRLEQAAASLSSIVLRELPPGALLGADFEHGAIRGAVEQVQRADVVLISTPIYKAAYSGLLKVFLDLLPKDALAGKTILRVGTGGSSAHLLALDYALAPVLVALGARDIGASVYATDRQLAAHETGGFVPDDELLVRLDRALASVFAPAPAVRDGTGAPRSMALERCS